MKIPLFSLTALAIISISLFKLVYANDLDYILVINEIMPNPIGDDTKYEWIELKNVSKETVNLKDWMLNGNNLLDYEIAPDEIVLLVRDETSFDEQFTKLKTSINLINSGGTLTLSKIDGSKDFNFTYTQSIEGRSFEKMSGKCNTISIHPVSDTMGLNNTPCGTIVVPTNTVTPTQIYHITYKYGDIKIWTISPYPSQDSEWVELYNPGSVEIDLAGWIISDESGKSFRISNMTLNSGAKTKIFPSTISLNNDGDTVNLYDTQNTLIDTLTYEKVSKDQLVASVMENTDNVPSSLETNKELNLDNSNSEEVKSLQYKIDEKSIQDVLKKPIYYKVGEY